jgi:hypothetical protein
VEKMLMAGLVIKNMMLPNILQDNSFWLNFDWRKDFFVTLQGRKFISEDVDNNFILGSRVAWKLNLTHNPSNCTLLPFVKEIPDASENAQDTACASLVSYAVTEVEPNIQTLSVPTLQSLSSKENMIISSLEFSAITGSDTDSSSVVKPVKNRGRPTKTSAPKSEAQVRRCTRLHNKVTQLSVFRSRHFSKTKVNK